MSDGSESASRSVGDEPARVSRRAFLTGTVATGAATAASSSAAGQQQTTIDMTDNLVFDPDEATVAPGTTVVWENVGNIGHSVTAYEDDIPADAEYFASGGFGSESAARSAYPNGDVAGGESYQHTFSVVGTYEYFCIPHEGTGMVGAIEVAEGGGGGEETAAGPTLPDSALTLGVAATTALVSIVAMAYVFLKYGGDYELPGETERGED